MPRRSLITAITVVVVLGLLVLLPSVPFVREAIVARALRLVEGLGVSVEYAASGGNPWRGIALEGARVRAPGVDVEVDRLRLGYFLPSLLGGELPLDVHLAGVDGDVDLQELLDTLAASGGGGGGVSVRLRNIALDDVAVNAARLPFTLPDLSVDALRLEQQGASLLLDIALSTSSGRVAANGRYDALTGSFNGEVTHADVGVARHWWDGAIAGSASGPISLRGGLIEGRLQVRDAEVLHDGLHATAVSGEVRMRYPVIEAELSGTAFGGPVSARGVVNVSAQRWEVAGLATAELEQAAAWLARSQFPDGLPLDVSGVGDVQLQLSGWRQIEAGGEVSAAGTVQGVALDAFGASFRLPADGVLRVDGTGTLGGAPLTLGIGPGGGGTRTQLRAAGVDLAGAGLPGLLDLVLDANGSAGTTVDAQWRGELGGRALSAVVEAELTPDGWAGYLTGSDDQGASFEGAAVLSDGSLQGEVTVLDVMPGFLTPSGRLSVRAAGPLSALALTLTLAGPEAVTLAALGDGAPDLRGAATAELRDGRLEAISGGFGPVAVAGSASLSPFAGSVSVRTDPLSLEAGGGGAVRGTAAISDGVLEFGAAGTRWRGDLVTSDVVVSAGAPLAVAVPPLRLAGELGEDAPYLSALAEDGSIALTFGADGIDLRFADLRLAAVPDAAGASGADSAEVAAVLSGRLNAPSGSGPFDFQLRAADGARLGGVPLASGAELAGTLRTADPGERAQLTATGVLGELPLSVNAAWAPGDLSLSAALTSAEGAVLTLGASTQPSAAVAPPASGLVGGPLQWRLEGAVAVASVLGQLGIDASSVATAAAPAGPVLTGTMTGSWADGSLTDLAGVFQSSLSLTAEAEPLSLEVRGLGSRLGVELAGELGGLPVSVVGDVAPAGSASGAPSVSGVASVGPLTDIALDLQGASGSGNLELALAPASGPAVSIDVPWRLEASWASATARVDVGDGGFDLRLVDGALHASGATSLTAYVDGEELEVQAALTGEGPLRSASEVVVTGAVLEPGSSSLASQPLIAFEGPLDALAVTGDLSLARILGVLGVGGFSPSGSVTLAGVVDVTDGPRYAADLALQASPSADSAGYDLAGSVQGSGAELSVELSGAGFDLRYAGGELSVTALGASLQPLLPPGFASSVDGTLRLAAGAWTGELGLAVDGDGVALSGTLFGAGDRLIADLGAEHQLGSLAASGTVVPELALSGSLSALDGSVTGSLTFDGPGGLSADLRSEPVDLDYAFLPAQTARLSWRPGSAITLVGESVQLSASGPAEDAELSGTLRLGGNLLDEPASLVGGVGGTVGEPRFEAQLLRDGVRATLSGGPDLVLVDGEVDPTGVSDGLRRLAPGAAQVEGALTEPIGVGGSWSPATGFQASVATTVAAGGAGSFDVGLALSGTPDSYGGQLSLSGAAGPLARIEVTGAGADLRAVLDLAAVEWAAISQQVGVDFQVSGGGSLNLASSPPSATLDADIRAVVGGVEVALSGSSEDRLELSIGGQGVSVTGALDVGEAVTAVLTGEIRGEPLSVDIELGRDLASGRFSAVVPGIAAEGTLAGEDGRFELTSLTAIATTAPGPLAGFAPFELTASGALAPEPEVSGVLVSLPTGETASLRFGASGAGSEAASQPESPAAMLLTIAWRDLLATFDPASSTARVVGSLELEDGADGISFEPGGRRGGATGPTRVVAESLDLSWSPSAGLSGEATLWARLPQLDRLVGISQVDARFVTDASGRLELIAAAGRELSLSATLPPLLVNGDSALDGELSFALGIDGELGALLVEGTPAVSGTLTDPAVFGPLRLSGDVAGAGEVSYSAGAGGIRLAGDHLTLALAGQGSHWSADVSLQEYPLPDTLPQAGGATLSLQATGTAAPELSVTVSGLRLAKGASVLTGGAVLGQSVRVALQAQLDLADLDLGEAEAHGLLRGPVVLTAATPAELRAANVTAMLDAARLGYGAFGSLSGSLQVGGSLADPRVSALLAGDGAVSGGLRFDASPARGRLTLVSDLAVAGFQTDIDLTVDAGAVRARGIGRYGEAAVFVSESESGLQLTGAGRLEGWNAAIEASLGSAQVRGPLASLVAGLEGSVAIALGGPEDEPWLRGRVDSVALGDTELGDLTVTSQALGARIDVEGDGLSFSIEPTGLAWSASADGLRLPAGLLLDLTGAGNGATGSGRARLSTADGAPAALAGTNLDLRFALQDALRLEGSGEVLGGALSLTATRSGSDGGWAGQLSLAGASAGGLSLELDGMLLGDGLVPNAVLASSLRGGSGQIDLSGRLAFGSQGISVDQQLAGDALGGVLRIQGRAFPNTDLRLGAEPPLEAGETSNVHGALRLFTTGQGLRSSGQLRAALGPVALHLEERVSDGALLLHAELPSLGAGASAVLDGTDLVALVSETFERGLSLSGTGAASGDLLLTVATGPRIELIGFEIEAAGFVLSASGTASLDSADLSGDLLLPTDVPVATASGRLSLPWTASLQAGRLRVSSAGELGSLEVAYDADGATLLADVDLSVPRVVEGVAQGALTSGSVRGRLGYTPAGGASGTLEVDEVRLTPGGLGPVTIAADVAIADDRIGGAATVDTAGGRLSLSGDWGLAGLLPGQPSAQAGGNVELRVRTLEISAFPAVAAAVPHASGAVSGVVQLRDGLLLGQLLVPELVLGEERSEATFEITGTPERIVVAARLLGSLFTSELAGGRLSGSARLERFPIELLAESVVGPTDVSADLTGVMRFEVPLADPADGYLRLATERFLLERAGVITGADLSLVYQDRELLVERAEFDGRGSWQASGRLGSEVLDFRLDAVDADFTPLLGLVPQLARLGVGAQGSFSFSASGSAADPSIRLTSDGLAFAISGTSFEFQRADVLLEGDELTAAVDLVSGAPAAGRLDVDGRARLQLDPLALREIDFGIMGSLAAPGFGVIEDIVGSITLTPDFLPYLRVSGVLGAPISVSGTLVPLDLRAGGTGLNVSIPDLLIGRAVVDADLRLHSGPAGLTLGGVVRADEVLIDPAAGSSASAPAPAEAAAATSAGASTPARPAATVSGTTRPAPVGLVFDGLRITAPQRVTFDSSFAALEAAVDLTLSGDVADPRLSGSASALRGSLRFAGREFAVTTATATFSPARGYYPDLEVVAHTDVLKSSALQGARGIEFVAPDGPSLRITLAFSGPVESAPGADGGFRFDVRPVLTSDALIEVNDGGAVSSVRPLTEAELLTLLTLGRLELNPELVGSGGLGGAVAQGALDTAVDLLVVGELQNALREALGLDVVEIRTSAFSSLLGDNGTPFSVSVRLGGYINPELFASYRIGTRDDAAFGITNEVTLSYALGPIDLDLSGRLDFPAPGVIAPPRPELGFGLRYDFSPSLSIDGGLVLSTERSVIRFGVSLRW